MRVIFKRAQLQKEGANNFGADKNIRCEDVKALSWRLLRLLRTADLLHQRLRQEWDFLQATEVDEWLDGAADVQEGVSYRLDIAGEDQGRIVILKGEQGYQREVVKDDDAQDGEHHLKSFFLHGVHLVLSRASRTLQRPQDGHVADHHPGERCQDLSCEYLLEVRQAADGFRRGVSEGEAKHDHCQANPVLNVLQLTKSDREDHSDKAIQTDAGQEEWSARVLHTIGELQR